MAKTTNKQHKVYQADEAGNLILVADVKAPQKGSALVAAGQEEDSKLQEGVGYIVLGPKELDELKIKIERTPKVTIEGGGRKGGPRGKLTEEQKAQRAATRAANKAAKEAEAQAQASGGTAQAANPFEGDAAPAA